jgi:hypothetical protein
VASLGEDDVTLSGGSASFADKNVGSDKTVTASGFSLSGDDKANYALGTIGTATASITKRSVTGSFTAADKVYDGTAAASITGRSLSGVVGEDDVTLSGGSASFADKNVGSDKTVTASGFSLWRRRQGQLQRSARSGRDGFDHEAFGDRVVHRPPTRCTTGRRQRRSPGRSLTGVLGEDDVTLSGGSASFADKNVGSDKTVTASGFSLSGDDKANYALGTIGTATASITKRGITATFTVAPKVFDGKTGAEITGASLAGVLDGDEVSIDAREAVATFLTSDPGKDKAVSATGFKLAGKDAGNYDLTTQRASADIVSAADTIAPGAPKITSGPKTSVSSPTATFVIEPAEGGGTLECRVDGGDWRPCSGGSTSDVVNGLKPGDHTFEVRQTDAAGNVSETASWRWTVVAQPAVVEGSPRTVASSSAAPQPLTLANLRVTAPCVSNAELGTRLLPGRKPFVLSYTLSRQAKVMVTIARRNPSMARKSCTAKKMIRKAGNYEDMAVGELPGETGDNAQRVGSARIAAAPLAKMAVDQKSSAGANTIAISPLLQGRKLRPGTYRVLAYAVAADGARTPLAKTVFRVLGK